LTEPPSENGGFALARSAAIVIGATAVAGVGFWLFVARPSPQASASLQPIAAPRARALPAIPTDADSAPARPIATAAPLVPSSDGARPSSIAPSAAPLPLEDLVARVSPAVVLIETTGGRGTGFFVRPDTIITNAHVTGSDVSVRVRRSSGDILNARVDAVAQDVDLAVLRLAGAPADQATVSLGSAARIRIGEEVMAIGSAMGVFQNTVTRGIVSGIRQAGAVTLVQTDAAINPGNSGGPLIDRNGDVIGITTMGLRSAQGISFAVAVDHAEELLAGKHASTTSATPLASLNQTLTSRQGPSDVDVARAQATRSFEQMVAQLARRADALDDAWRSFRGACYEGRIVGAFDREWFALWDGRAMQGAVSPSCGNAFADLKQRASAIHQGVAAADEGARQADIFPGTRRDILHKYRLDYVGWDR
jgi:S1-C subfamily serine protease